MLYRTIHYETSLYSGITGWLDCYKQLLYDNSDINDTIKLYRTECMIYYKQQLYGKALQAIQQAYDLDNSNTITNTLLIRCLLACNQQDECVKITKYVLDNAKFKSNILVLCMLADDAQQHNMIESAQLLLSTVLEQTVNTTDKMLIDNNDDNDNTIKTIKNEIDRVAIARSLIDVTLTDLSNKYNLHEGMKVSEIITNINTDDLNKFEQLSKYISILVSILLEYTSPSTIPHINKEYELLHKLINSRLTTAISIGELIWFCNITWNILLCMSHTNHYNIVIKLANSLYTLLCIQLSYIKFNKSTNNDNTTQLYYQLYQCTIMYASCSMEQIWFVNKDDTVSLAKDTLQVLNNTDKLTKKINSNEDNNNSLSIDLLATQKQIDVSNT